MQDTPADPVMPNADLERRRIPSLLAGYWAFGQYWGIWVILVVRSRA